MIGDRVRCFPSPARLPDRRPLLATRHAPLSARADAEDPSANPSSVAVAPIHRAVLGSPGTSLPYLDRIERSFGGVDLGGLRAHLGLDAAASARGLQASAYTTAGHVVFDGTPTLRTVAHEAAHAVRQSIGADATSGRSGSGDGERRANDVAERVVAGRMAQDLLGPRPPWSAAAVPAAVLTPPGRLLVHRQPATVTTDPWHGFFHVGAIGYIRIAMLLQDLYGDQQRRLADAIRADPAAVAIVKASGVSGVVALLDTRRPNGTFDPAAARALAPDLTWPVLEARAGRTTAAPDASKLVELERWAEAETGKQHVLDAGKVVGLDPKKASDVAEIRKRIAPLKPNAEAVGAALTAIRPLVNPAIKTLQTAASGLDSPDEVQRMEAKGKLIAADDQLEAIAKPTFAALKKADLESAVFQLQAARRALAGLLKPNLKLASDHVQPVIDHLTRFRTQLATATTGQQNLAKSVERVDFLLRMFLFTNATVSGMQDAPTADEIRTIGPLLSTTPEDDFIRVFAALGAGDVAMLSAFGELLSKQLAVRATMTAKGVTPAGAVPTRGDAEAWFTSLRAASNDEVAQAYMHYAEAFFYHRIEDNLADLAALTLDQIFARDLSITGVRGIVCTGYAMLGARLLSRAGGRVETFVMAVRASDDQIRSNRIDSGHALAKVTRNGATMFVSNDLIVSTEVDGIGPDAVAWHDKTKPLHTARGTTVLQAHTALVNQLTRIANP